MFNLSAQDLFSPAIDSRLRRCGHIQTASPHIMVHPDEPQKSWPDDGSDLYIKVPPVGSQRLAGR
ncbi:protein of unknown function [Candidatus Filomicrobium marinum]|uniref:Uncharacterized protein n=1 Tax=Candidatus Filomicrobium marinum TaxID=1608628 RepID=A0A0D6JCA2_9HYPH|nr:protein of unknown function [Candidatus Filomicrobium marinum]CPR17075.1 protein of unknown function [Candidatus Filomicrobium marinum]